VIWIGRFGTIEKVTAFLGLITICFLVAVFKARPQIHDVVSGLIPQRPDHAAASYWLLAISIIGAIISPYMLYFYSSGAIEEKWDQNDLGVNRGVSILGMTFGSVIAMSITIVAARVLLPAGIAVDHYEQASVMLIPAFGRWGTTLFAASLAIACFGAAIEGSLAVSYVVAQSFGWEWGEDLPPKENARFAFTYTLLVVLASLLAFSGIDPLKLTMWTMAMVIMVVPIVVGPMLVIMNDEKYLHEHRNGWISNTAGVLTLAGAIVMAFLAIPLQIIGG
jgi:Mn2+/Fe2+ NRAMP family transporter